MSCTPQSYQKLPFAFAPILHSHGFLEIPVQCVSLIFQ